MFSIKHNHLLYIKKKKLRKNEEIQLQKEEENVWEIPTVCRTFLTLNRSFENKN